MLVSNIVFLYSRSDTLLNVFLAIAVDNLTNAEILTHDEEAEENGKKIEKLNRFLASDQELAKKALTFVNSLHSQSLCKNTDSNGHIVNDSKEVGLSSPVKQTEQNGVRTKQIDSPNSNNHPIVIVQSPQSMTKFLPIYQPIDKESNKCIDSNHFSFSTMQYP